MNNGYIRLHRKVLDNVFCKKNSKKIGFWVLLLLMANHKENTFFLGNTKISLKQGQLLTGRQQLVIKSGLNRNMIERFLKLLEIEHQIEQQKTNKYRIITILNWNKYQIISNEMSNKRATDEQQKSTNNNVKNDNNIVASDKREFSYKNLVETMLISKDVRLTIIANYWLINDFTFANKEQYNAGLKRELKPAGNLKGYKLEHLIACMKWIKKTKDFKWTLESVHKYIDNYIKDNKLILKI